MSDGVRREAQAPLESRGARLRRWLRPGMGLKRWLLVIFVGELLIAFAGALVLRAVYREVAHVIVSVDGRSPESVADAVLR